MSGGQSVRVLGLDKLYPMCLSMCLHSMQLDARSVLSEVSWCLIIDIARDGQYNDSVSSLGKCLPLPPSLAAGWGGGVVRAGSAADVERDPKHSRMTITRATGG